ncbi:hypothetical protein WO83_14655 [Listeria monocytogenes]|nr:hypothetical protein [Listeria monocytogenes]
MKDFNQRIRECFGDVAPRKLAEILQIHVKKIPQIEIDSALIYSGNKPIIHLGWEIDVMSKQGFIKIELIKYLEAYPEYLERNERIPHYYFTSNLDCPFPIFYYGPLQLNIKWVVPALVKM